MIRYPLDENVNPAVANGLHLRGIDVTTTADVSLIGATGEQQLAYAYSQGRVIVTHEDDLLSFIIKVCRTQVLPTAIRRDAVLASSCWLWLGSIGLVWQRECADKSSFFSRPAPPPSPV